jgi:amidase
VFLGLTNMPPMANGGMQRGLYGRAESPYNGDYLTSAFGSGSSNGSGTATAASFSAFGLGEETWSSGRAPASNNALCAYTPSRGVISVRGNWPLVPTMDVVVPHTRTMADLLEVLDVLVADDPEKRGDLWRTQPWVPIPRASEVRPPSYPALAADAATSLAGKRFGIPSMYLGQDPDAGTGEGIGASTGQRIEPRPTVLALWEQARADLEAAGAEVVVVDFPVVSNYEADRAGAPSIFDRGIVPAAFFDVEIWDMSMWSWHDFLAANGQPGLSSLAEVEGAKIFPHPDGALPDRYGSFDLDISEYVTRARADGISDPLSGPHAALIRAGLEGLERTRRTDLEDWMRSLGLDAVVFPAVADVGPADADVNEESAAAAWRNGVWVANGNLAIRHLGIPTVTVPMGTMSDIGMPVGLTFAGHAYADADLLRWAAGFESLRPRRTAPPRTPELEGRRPSAETSLPR